MAAEKPFEREVLDRLITMENKIDTITTLCPQCQNKIDAHGLVLVAIEQSTKSAHHRIDGIYKEVGVISTIVGAVIGGLFTLLNYLSQKGGHG